MMESLAAPPIAVNRGWSSCGAFAATWPRAGTESRARNNRRRGFPGDRAHARRPRTTSTSSSRPSGSGSSPTSPSRPRAGARRQLPDERERTADAALRSGHLGGARAGRRRAGRARGRHSRPRAARSASRCPRLARPAAAARRRPPVAALRSPRPGGAPGSRGPSTRPRSPKWRARAIERARLVTPSDHARARRFYGGGAGCSTDEGSDPGLGLDLVEYRLELEAGS